MLTPPQKRVGLLCPLHARQEAWKHSVGESNTKGTDCTDSKYRTSLDTMTMDDLKMLKWWRSRIRWFQKSRQWQYSSYTFHKSITKWHWLDLDVQAHTKRFNVKIPTKPRNDPDPKICALNGASEGQSTTWLGLLVRRLCVECGHQGL